MVDEKVRREEWVRYCCPKDCPFNDKLGDLNMRYCSFSSYADILEPGRHTRTEVDADGHVNYHVWPDCDVYGKYKNMKSLVLEMKRRARTKHLRALPSGADVAVTARKRPKRSKHKGEF
jgi:hypothetical protein